MTFVRLRDWQTRLRDFARDRRAMPFEWGKNDCCLFAADAVLAMTGRDPAEGLRTYSTAAGAKRVLKKRGGVAALAASVFGPSVSPKRAAVGDVVLVLVKGEEALGLFNGSGILGPSADGVTSYGVDAAVACWRIG